MGVFLAVLVALVLAEEDVNRAIRVSIGVRIGLGRYRGF